MLACAATSAACATQCSVVTSVPIVTTSVVAFGWVINRPGQRRGKVKNVSCGETVYCQVIACQLPAGFAPVCVPMSMASIDTQRRAQRTWGG